MGSRIIGLNEAHRRIGEDHGRARLTNADVERIRQLHDEGIGYTRLSKMFEVSRTAVRKIVHGQMRMQTPSIWKRCRGT